MKTTAVREELRPREEEAAPGEEDAWVERF
jgi:hypothetical protein